jgi:acetolactate synthase-1/2/3 large subunit
MNGAESLIRTAHDAGIDVCFANPGTTEMPLVVALDAVSGIRPVLGLFEGVCTGAADGFGRMAGRPAMTLLHLGPGLANGLANLHNARRARTPVVNVVGDHSTGHLQFDSPLKSDIEALAAPVSHWVRTSTDAHRIGADVADAVLAAVGPPGHVATLIIPADLQSAPATGAAPISKPAAPPAPESSRVVAALDALRLGKSSALLVGGPACQRGALESAARRRRRTGPRRPPTDKPG